MKNHDTCTDEKNACAACLAKYDETMDRIAVEAELIFDKSVDKDV